MLGIKNLMLYTRFFQKGAEQLAAFNAYRTHQHRLPRCMRPAHLFHHGPAFALKGFINGIVHILSYHGLICRNANNIKIINAVEFLLLRLCRTRHAGELLVHTEIVLICDCSKRLIFSCHLNMLFGFDSLMQPLAVSPAHEYAPGKLIYNKNLTVLYDIVSVLLKKEICLKRLYYMMIQFLILRIRKVSAPEYFFAFCNAFIGKLHGFRLFIKREILILNKTAYGTIHNVVHFGGFFTGTGNNKRRTRFIDQYAVDLVHYCIIQLSLHPVAVVYYHIVTQIIKAELTVCSVGDIAAVCLALFLRLHLRQHSADAQPQEVVQLAHPVRLKRCQILIYRYDMNALSFQRIKICRQRSHQRFALASAHFGNSALMQHDSAYKLNNERLHAKDTPCRLAANRKSFNKYIIGGFTLCQTPAEFRRLCFELCIAELFHLRRKRIYFQCDSAKLLYIAFVLISEYRENTHHKPPDTIGDIITLIF